MKQQYSQQSSKLNDSRNPLSPKPDSFAHHHNPSILSSDSSNFAGIGGGKDFRLGHLATTSNLRQAKQGKRFDFAHNPELSNFQSSCSPFTN